jgi:hypothetical protein
MRSCPHPLFLGRRQKAELNKNLYFEIILGIKNLRQAGLTIHQLFYRNTSLQPGETVKTTGKYKSGSLSKTEK